MSNGQRVSGRCMVTATCDVAGALPWSAPCLSKHKPRVQLRHPCGSTSPLDGAPKCSRAHLSASSCTSRCLLCGASFIAKMGDPGTSPCTCLNTNRTSSSLSTCAPGGHGRAESQDHNGRKRSHVGRERLGRAPCLQHTLIMCAAQRWPEAPRENMHMPHHTPRCSWQPARRLHAHPATSLNAHTAPWLTGTWRPASRGPLPHLADALAAAAPRSLQHHRVADAVAALERLAQAVDAGAVVNVRRDHAVGAGCAGAAAEGRGQSS